MYFIVSHFYHEPPAREIGQPLPVHLTVNKSYLYLYFMSSDLEDSKRGRFINSIRSLCACEDSREISISISFLLMLMLMFREGIVRHLKQQTSPT